MTGSLIVIAFVLGYAASNAQTIDSEAPEREICEALREADERCTWLQMARQPIRVCRETWFSCPTPDGAAEGPEQGTEC